MAMPATTKPGHRSTVVIEQGLGSRFEFWRDQDHVMQP